MKAPLPPILTRTSGRIGPGALIAVCGPSGAGKDTVLRSVQEMNKGRADIIFPRRIVTRPESVFEGHDSATEEQFSEMQAAGGFAFCWSAHGLRYALPATVDDHIRHGCCVVCNVSRAIVPELRSRYARTTAVLITAPLEILAARLAARGRVTDGTLSSRVARSAEVGHDLNPDIVIDNAGPIEAAARRLQGVIESQFVIVSF